MTDRKISELPAATLPLAGTALVAVVRGGVTEQVAVEQLSGRFSPIPSAFVAGTLMGTSGQVPTANRMLLVPYTSPRRMTVQRFNIRTHATSGSSDFALAIYASGANGLPTGAPIYGGAPFTPTYNFVYVGYSGLSLTLEPRRYWLAFAATAAAGSYTESGSNPASFRDIQADIGYANQVNLATTSVIPFVNGVTPGTWPSLTARLSDFAGYDATFRCPAFSFQVAA